MLLQDVSGVIRLSLTTFQVQYIRVGLGGAVRSISMANQATCMQQLNEEANAGRTRLGLGAAVGDGGQIVIFDVPTKRVVDFKQTCGSRATKCLFLYNGLLLVVGFEDGTCKFYDVCTD